MTMLSMAPHSMNFDNSDTHIANQGAQTIQNQYNFLQRPTEPTASGGSNKRCVSVPFATVSTYTPRPHLSQKLKQKLSKAYAGHGLAHTVTVTGLGGSGKTQLVLRYIEEHEEEYDTILWIDARSEGTARSSFERCCRALDLPVEPASGERTLADVPTIQRILQWLRGGDGEKKWLVVVDNADDLSWDVSSIVPHGRVGSVIVTSQDDQASQLFGRSSERVRVDVMEADEAMALFWMTVNISEGDRTEALTNLAREVTGRLDCLPLAIDIAGARIRGEAEDDEKIEEAVRQYLADFEGQRERLLRNEDFVNATSRGKTVWAVWETSLSSIKRISMTESDVYPLELLSMMAKMDRSGIQDELFRLASLGLQETCKQTGCNVPNWLERVLAANADGGWNDAQYRASVRLLTRHGLVRSVRGVWPGVTMHSLVQWRALHGRDVEEAQKLFIILLTAACYGVHTQEAMTRFGRHLVVHLPPAKHLLAQRNESGASASRSRGQLWSRLKMRLQRGSRTGDVTWQWRVVSKVLYNEGRFAEEALLVRAVVEERSKMLGNRHPDTLIAKGNLALTYRQQGRLAEAEKLHVEVMEARVRKLGKEHLHALRAKGSLAATYYQQGRLAEAEALQVEVMEARVRELGEGHPDTLKAKGSLAATYQQQGRLAEAEKLELEVMKATVKELGEGHYNTLIAKGNLALTYQRQGRLAEAEALQVEVMEAIVIKLREGHPRTLKAKGNLALTYCDQGRLAEAEKLQVEVVEASVRELEEGHSNTLRAKGNLAGTYQQQGRLAEAEALQVEVMEAAIREPQGQHSSAKGNLALTYRQQGRLAEAEALQVEAMEARVRELGKGHPTTLRAKADLSFTYQDQERAEEAEQLQVEVLDTVHRSIREGNMDAVHAKRRLILRYRQQKRYEEAERLEAYIP